MRRILLLIACTSACSNGATASSGEEPGDGASASVSLPITAVPTGVFCVRVTATSTNRKYQSSFAVTPGTNTTVTMGTLPAGMPITFTADAFDVACSAVTDESAPSWMSDPKVATLILGAANYVELTLRKATSTGIGVGFECIWDSSLWDNCAWGP